MASIGKESMQAWRITAHGGADVLQWQQVDIPQPAAGQVLIKHQHVGVNFIDIYFREGLYPMSLPGGLGVEAAGEVVAIGEGVTHLKIGDRVVYVMSTPGAYAQYHTVDASKAILLPGSMDTKTAAAIALKGFTAAFLLHSLRSMSAGESILVYAAAGGVGQLLCQWANALGLEVIAAVSSESKVAIAQAAGAHHVICGVDEGLADRVRAIAPRGVQVVFDSVGAQTWRQSLDSLARRGWYVTYGNASGPVPPIAPAELQKRGSLVMTRPSLGDFVADRAELELLAQRLFQAVERGTIRPVIDAVFPLHEADQAQRKLQSRVSAGAIVLEV